jgi:hypothetical protein
MSTPGREPLPAVGTEYQPLPPPLVFVSYSRKQLAEAKLFVRRLQALGLRTWHDVDDIPAGTAWDDELDRGLRECDAVLGLLTPDSVTSKYVLDEFAAAEAYGKALIFVVLEPTVPPARFIRLQQLFYEPEREDAFFEELGREFDRLRDKLEKQRRRAQEQGAPEPEAPGATETSLVSAFRTFETSMRQVAWMEPGPAGTLWVTDEEMVRVFHLGSPASRERWLLPEEPWKEIFPLVWRGQVICADWNGGVHAFASGARRGDTALHAPAYSDQPAHLATRGTDDSLWAACWDGRILGWSPAGAPLLTGVTVPQLPRHLVPLPGWGVVVVDDADSLHGLQPEGKGFHWRAPGPVVTAWGHQPEGEVPTIFLLMEQGQILQLDTRTLATHAVMLPGRPTAWAHRRAPQGDEWTALALDSGQLTWFSWNSRRVSSSLSATLPFGVKQLAAVCDPRSPTALCVVGITDGREVFTVRDRLVQCTGVGPVEAIALDSTGAFLFCRNGGGVEGYRNPVLERAECSIQLLSVDGRLEKGAYQELTFSVLNDGPVAIRRLHLMLDGSDRVEQVQRAFHHRLAPGESTALRLGVKAKAHGTNVPLELHVELVDDAGPPATTVCLRIEVAVDGA